MKPARRCALLMLLAAIASAQNTSGVLSGVVQDSSGAPFADRAGLARSISSS
jgi:hypothetical protein